ncbi:MAG: anhydro-N-acetylmuramic acid kinase [Planctomycetes bacterium]|nr:anhydro-N-acetylmuramic acid kinase [Planctomycetota bacterium]
MAGTSCDGIDAACVRIVGEGEAMKVRLVHHRHQPFARSLQRRLLAVMAPSATRTEEIAHLHVELGEAFGLAARRLIGELGRRERPSVIGLSGQTVCHYPRVRRGRTVTLQLGSPAHVAAIAGLPVIADFRQSDVAVGGQGAPLVPWTDWVLFRHPKISRAVQNIGGIGNVTWIPAGCGARQVIAFDTGPGNMVIDGLVVRISGGRRCMDRDGRMASRGRVLDSVLVRWMSLPFFRQRPPRTTGREVFGEPFVARAWRILRAASRAPEDWVATATALTARSIALAYGMFLPGFVQDRGCRESVSECSSSFPVRRRSTEIGPRSSTQIILAGGGSRNCALRRWLERLLPQASVRTVDEFGIPAEAKEAVSFAVLAAARLDGTSSNVPRVTGASVAVPLGAVYG